MQYYCRIIPCKSKDKGAAGKEKDYQSSLKGSIFRFDALWLWFKLALNTMKTLKRKEDAQ